MKSFPLLVLASTLALCGPIGCANKPLSSVDRAKYRRVGFDANVKLPERYGYTDATMNGTAAVSANFGLVGALTGAALNAAHEGGARKNADQVIAGAHIDPAKVVSAHFQKEVEGLHLFDTKSATPDARFRLEVTNWGFGAGGSGLLSAALTARAELRDANDQVVWKRLVTATSPTSATIEGFQSNPKLFIEAFDEVADVVARKLTGEWE